MQDYYNYLWKSGKALEKNDLLVELPPYLKTKMNLFLNREIVTKVPLFKQAADDERFISALIGCLRGIVCLPNFFVVRKGEFGTDMYFISRGELNVVGDNGTVVFTLRDGGFFGEIALLYDTKRTATIVARTYCDMFLLTKEDFKKVLRQFPEQSQGIRQIAQERFQKIVEDEKKKEEAAAKARAEAAVVEAARAEEAKLAEQREEEARAAIAAASAPAEVFHNGAPVELVVSPKGGAKERRRSFGANSSRGDLPDSSSAFREPDSDPAWPLNATLPQSDSDSPIRPPRNGGQAPSPPEAEPSPGAVYRVHSPDAPFSPLSSEESQPNRSFQPPPSR